MNYFTQIMKHNNPIPSWLRILKKPPILHGLLLCIALFGGRAAAQAPIALQYPSSTVAVAGVTSVYMAPTVGNAVSSYSISPALPSGLSLNSTTGIISGVATAVSPATAYTVTATNASGSTTSTFNLQVAKVYYDVAYDTIRFINTPATITAIRGNGKNVGDSILYKNVITINGQQIDCIVTTKGLENVYYFSQYDQEAASGSGFTSNMSRFFSPQIVFDSAYGSATFSFEFILGNSYVNGANPGIPVYLQRVKLNTYDIDGSDAPGTNQFNAISGFDSSEISTATKLSMKFDTTSELTFFRSTTTANTAGVTNDSTRICVTYNYMSYFELRVGVDAGVPMDSIYSIAYFFTDFSPGPAFTTKVPTPTPGLDLNTGLAGVSNYARDCTGQMSFTATDQTNVLTAGGPTYRQLRVSIPAAAIKDGTSEQLVVSGASSGGTITISNHASAAMTLGSVNYIVTGTTVNGTRHLVFKRSSGSLVSSEIEALIDALRYVNTAASPTNGEREFTVALRDSVLQSPSLKFTAMVQCASIAGNIYRDANALTDNTVNANSSNGQFGASGIYAVLTTTAATNNVVNSVPVTTGGAYSFGRVNVGSYNVVLSSNSPAAGTTKNSATYPSTYIATGEYLGTDAGHDGTVNGMLRFTVGSTPVTNANLGVQLPPVAGNKTLHNYPNPGGYNVIPFANVFNYSDADGTVDSIIITSFPSNTNFLKVGNTLYRNGNPCPPQGTCVNWPGSVKFHVSLLPQVGADPNATGSDKINFTYKVIDNGRAQSGTGSVEINFLEISKHKIEGYVWHDQNGNANRNGHENYLSFSYPGQALFALLVQTSNTYSGQPTVYASKQVNASSSGFQFDNVPGGQNYEIRISSLSGAPTDGVAFTTALQNPGPGWTCVTLDNKSNKTYYPRGGNNNPVITITNLNGDDKDNNFGMEQIPTADPKALTAPLSAFTTVTVSRRSNYRVSHRNSNSGANNNPTGTGASSEMNNGALYRTNSSTTLYKIQLNNSMISGASVKSLSGKDPEDCSSSSSCNTGRTFMLMSINPNTTVLYNYGSGDSVLNDSAVISNFNLSKMALAASSGQSLGFTYSLMDSAEILSPPAVFSLQMPTPLAVELTSFTGKVHECNATIDWTVETERNGDYYVLEQSADGHEYLPVAIVACTNSSAPVTYSALAEKLYAANFFRLKRVDLAGEHEYSKTLRLSAPSCSTRAITVSPNPAQDHISVSGFDKEGHSLFIFNSMGSLVYKTINTQSVETIDIKHYATGAYLIKIVDEAGKMLSTTRFIKE